MYWNMGRPGHMIDGLLGYTKYAGGFAVAVKSRWALMLAFLSNSFHPCVGDIAQFMVFIPETTPPFLLFSG